MSKNRFSKTSLEKRLSELLALRDAIYQEKRMVNREISEIKRILADYEKLEALKSISVSVEKLK